MTQTTMSPAGLAMSPRFTNALNYVLVNEGPYSNDPRDPGGATKYGIVLTEYESYLKKTLTPNDVENMDLPTAQAIYLRSFWHPIQGDAYASDAVATAIFDTAVNKGLGGCKIILEDALKGNFGGEAWQYQEDLLAAVNALSPQGFITVFEPAVERYINARVERFPNMTWAQQGWLNRAQKLFTLVQA